MKKATKPHATKPYENRYYVIASITPAGNQVYAVEDGCGCLDHWTFSLAYATKKLLFGEAEESLKRLREFDEKREWNICEVKATACVTRVY